MAAYFNMSKFGSMQSGISTPANTHRRARRSAGVEMAAVEQVCLRTQARADDEEAAVVDVFACAVPAPDCCQRCPALFSAALKLTTPTKVEAGCSSIERLAPALWRFSPSGPSPRSGVVTQPWSLSRSVRFCEMTTCGHQQSRGAGVEQNETARSQCSQCALSQQSLGVLSEHKQTDKVWDKRPQQRSRERSKARTGWHQDAPCWNAQGGRQVLHPGPGRAPSRRRRCRSRSSRPPRTSACRRAAQLPVRSPRRSSPRT